MSKAQKEKKEEIEWDKKRIIAFCIAAVFLIALALYLKNAFLGESSPAPKTEQAAVKGVSTEDIANGIKQSVQTNVGNLKTEAENLNVADIATSSPQVQKILNDLKSIQDLPKSQLKSTCEKVCSGL